MRFLRQSTATVIETPPLIDDTDGKTPEDALTVASIDVQLMQPLDSAAVPPDRATNGAFTSDTGWTKGTGWDIDTTTAGKAHHATGTASDLEQTPSLALVENVAYELVFVVSGFSAGTVTPKIGGTAGTARSSDATFTETIIAGSGSLIEFTANSTFVGDLDDVVYKQVPIPITPAASASSNDMVLIRANTGAYWLELTANQLAIVGRHRIQYFISGALIAWEDFMVIEEAVWDVMYASAAPGPAKPGDSMDISSISGDSGAADNLELMYDGTGYTDDTAPASRSQVSSIVNTGAAINVLAIASPDGFTLTTGSEVNDEDSTHALDGINHELSDAAGTLDAVYKFDIGGDAAPVGLQITGVFNSANDSWAISANAGTDGTPVWQQVGTISGTGGTGTTVHPFDLFSDQIVSDLAGIVQIRVSGTGLTSSSFDVDQIFVSKSDTSRSVGYEGGAVWINGGSNSGTEPFVDGVADNASDNIATARLIADNASLNLKVFHTLPMVTNTLGETYNAFEFIGIGWLLVLNGKNVNNSHFFNAVVSGIGTAADLMGFHDCTIGTASLQKARCTNCSFTATVTMTLAGSYRYIDCQSGVAGASAPTFVKTSGQAITAEFRRWSGGITISGLESGDTITIGGPDVGTITLNGADATVEVRGIYKKLVNNLTGSPTVTEGGLDAEDIAAILVDTDTTIPDLIAVLNDLSAAEVNAEVSDVLKTDVITLPGQAAPPLTPTFEEALAWLYKVFRNRKTQTATQWSLLADDESTVDAKATISDDTTTAIKQEIVTGP